ncbi:deoxyhypusine synthase [Candidatus Methanarcanum hacksteinii]|uniref:deoxyhypusine synthase n=1 Tax=Candidatus Methanarcanum hacksteinii TaxID=2911857 RepID=UPI0037DD95D4
MVATFDNKKLVAVKDIKIKKGMTANDLVKMMGKSGGFTAQKLSDAADIVEKMFKKKDCLRILSFPACIMATGTRGVIVDMVKKGFIDVIITTCGTLDHDLSRTWASYYKGDFLMDDAKLRDNGISRLGNVLVPDDCYGIVLEDNLLPMFDDIFKDTTSLSTHEIIDQVGARLDDEDSLLYQCHKHNVPIVVPGITDGSFGCQLWMYYQMHRKLRIDLFADEQMLSEMTDEAKNTGAIIIGGGISKHHVIWWNQFRGGLDYAIYLTTAQEYDGSLSGAQIREAVSWGKVKANAKKMTVEGDATINLPLIIAAVEDRL